MASRADEIARLEQALADVRASIARTLDKRAYNSGETGLSVERVSLAELERREQRLEAQLARLRRGTRIFYGAPLR